MLQTILAIFIRIISNSTLNVFQKGLTLKGQKASIINFHTYFGLTIICQPLLLNSNINYSSTNLLINVLIMGLLGALGNYFIIKALSIGELSTLAPINSYKPVVALLVGIFYLGEIPSVTALLALGIIIIGTLFLFDYKTQNNNKKAIFYRILALIFSATEAIFIKRIILLTDVSVAFYLWCIAGCVTATLLTIGNTEIKNCFKFKSIKLQTLLILSVALMQYSTNYVFKNMNVAYALALFQLSTIISVIFGKTIFQESHFRKKLLASILMVIGAIILILQ